MENSCGPISAAVAYYFIFSLYFHQLHPYTLVRITAPGASSHPELRQQKSEHFYSTVRHPELIALYASALNRVFGQ